MIPALNGVWLLLTIALIIAARWILRSPRFHRWVNGGTWRDPAPAWRRETDGHLWTPGGRP